MFQFKKRPRILHFYLKKINIQSNFINTKKIIIIETHIFPKLIEKMFQSFFLSTKSYLLFDFIKKIKIIAKNGLFNLIISKSK